MDIKYYVDLFVLRMNEKAASLGMINSKFNDPAGIDNYSSASDMMKCVLAASQNQVINEVWSRPNYTYSLGGVNPRELNVVSKTLTGVGVEAIRDYYKVLGGKGGVLVDYKQYNSAVLVDNPHDSNVLACVIMGAEDPRDKSNNCFKADKQAIDCALGKGDSVCAKSAIVCVKPDSKTEEPTVLYSKNADEVTRPASTSKILTAITALDYIKDLDDTVEVTEEMIALVKKGFYQKMLKAGDVIKIRDLLHVMMLPSSNLGAFVLAAYSGRLISEGK